MDDPPLVRRVERAGNLGHQPGGLAGRERPVAPDQRGEILAVDKLHDQVRPGVIGAEVVDAHDAGVAERRGGVGLLAEAGHEVGIVTVFRVQHLDSDVAAELAVGGPVDRGHAALAQQLDEAIAPAEHVAETSHDPSPSSAAGRRSAEPRR